MRTVSVIIKCDFCNLHFAWNCMVRITTTVIMLFESCDRQRDTLQHILHCALHVWVRMKITVIKLLESYDYASLLQLLKLFSTTRCRFISHCWICQVCSV